MAESNGELLAAGDLSATKSEDRGGDGERTEDYSKLLEYGLDKKVCLPKLNISLLFGNNFFFKLFRLLENWTTYTKQENWHI